MIDIKDQHIYLWRQKSCSLLEASVLPWRSSGTVRLLCEEMVDGSGHPFLEFRHTYMYHTYRYIYSLLNRSIFLEKSRAMINGFHKFEVRTVE